jgi:GNAT superfamily N-acetyltransferase
MWTHPNFRRRGLAGAVLEWLEAEATRLGFLRLRLETGTKQPEAISLYLKHGYLQISGYGRYRTSSDSLSLERVLRHACK